jgi:hypothetical protein
MSRLASPRFPATCRGSGIPFDRQSSVLPGSVVSTVERLHRRPTVSDKSGKRRANTPSAPENSQNDHLEPKLKRGPRRVMQEPRLVWAFVGPPRVWRSGVPANRKRSGAGNRPTPPRRNFTCTFPGRSTDSGFACAHRASRIWSARSTCRIVIGLPQFDPLNR